MNSRLRQLMLGFFIVALGAIAGAISIPHTFTAGTTISATQMNENFTAVKSAIDPLEAFRATLGGAPCDAGYAIQAIALSGTTTCIAVGAEGGGLTSVTSDATLSGDGTPAQPLGIADNGVTEAKIASGAVTSSRIGDFAVTESKIGGGAVTATKIASGAVTSAKIASGAVGTSQLALYAVTSDRIASNAVNRTHISDEPGVVQAVNSGSVTVTGTSLTVLASTTITVPSSGFVLVNATWMAAANKSLGQTATLYAGVSNSSGSLPADQYLLWAVTSNLPDGYYSVSQNAQRVFAVASPGTYTFYALGLKENSAHVNITVSRRSISAVYIPTAYGTVSGG